MDEEKSNTWRDVVSILALFYIPPIGVIVMWLTSRWSTITKWIVTLLIGIIPLAILGTTSFIGYKFTQFQRNIAPVLGVQQALDMYGIANNKYPDKLQDLKPKYLTSIPDDKDIQYIPTEDRKSFSLKAKINGKDVELRPALAQLPAK
jgi:ABC-type multidrug transport system fused ATPase/permease subunit